MVLNNPIKNSYAFTKFIWGKSYSALNDPALVKHGAMLNFLYKCGLCFVPYFFLATVFGWG